MHKLFLIFSLCFSTIVQGQDVGMEQSVYHSGHMGTSLVPVISLQSKKNWYGEVRYNYEDFKTFSFHLGKNFSKEGKLSYSISPIIGGLIGNTKGLSLGSNAEFSINKWTWFTQTQFVFSSQDFFYTWSELFYSPNSWLYLGPAIQHTKLQSEKHLWEPGVGAGVSIKNLSITLYDFVTLPTKEHTFVLSLILEKKK